MGRKDCCYLVYRGPVGGPWEWDKPTGGMVLQGKRNGVFGHAILDMQDAYAVALERFHCAPKEAIMLVEVYQEPEIGMARELQHEYDCELHSFVELMLAE